MEWDLQLDEDFAAGLAGLNADPAASEGSGTVRYVWLFL